MKSRAQPPAIALHRKQARLHPSALGGLTIDGPYFRRRSRIESALDRFFYWLGA